MKRRMMVRLNGTDTNPWHKLGLRCNPFPQLAHAELGYMERRIAELGGDPIKDEAELRKRLVGAAQEFVDGCVARFVPGEMIEFQIEIEV